MGEIPGPGPEIVSRTSNEQAYRPNEGIKNFQIEQTDSKAQKEDATAKPDAENSLALDQERIEQLRQHLREQAEAETPTTPPKVEPLSPELEHQAEIVTEQLETDLGVFTRSVQMLKRLGPQAGFIVPVGLGALAMANNTPIPAEILGRLATASGGAMLGFSRAPNEASKKLAYTLGGALGSTGLLEGVGHLNDSKTINLVANSLDDTPAFLALFTSFFRKAGEMGKGFISGNKLTKTPTRE